jgi:hypothetical protein
MQKPPNKPSEHLGETLHEGEAVFRRNRPALDPLRTPEDQVEDLQLGRDILDDTVAELEPVAPGDDEVALDTILDNPQLTHDASLTRYDPEAGRTNVSVKIRAVSEAVQNTLRTPFGKLLYTIPVFLAGIGLTIAAVTYQTWTWIGPALVVMPLGFVLAYWRYQAWLGSKRYMYRLLETLGEDVSDFDMQKRYRKVKLTARPRR